MRLDSEHSRVKLRAPILEITNVNECSRVSKKLDAVNKDMHNILLNDEYKKRTKKRNNFERTQIPYRRYIVTGLIVSYNKSYIDPSHFQKGDPKLRHDSQEYGITKSKPVVP